MTQHPPGHYAVAALVYDVLDAREWRYDHALFLLRAVTALMVAVTVPACCYVAARALSGSETLGRIAAFVPLLVPQLHYLSGVVTNDGATIATTAAVWALLLTLMASGPTRRRLLLLAVAIGAACWVKGTAISLLPVVPVVVAIAYRRHRGGSLRRWGPRALGATAGTLALAFALGGWWWAVNVVRYGRLQPSAYPIPDGDDARLGPLEFLLVFLRRIHRSFFGDLGVGEAPSLRALTLALAVVFVVACAVGLVTRHRPAERLVIVFGTAVVVGVLATTTYSAHLHSGRIPGIQGRYLFVLVVPIAALAVVGLSRLARLVHLRDRGLAAVCLGAGLGLTALGLVLGFRLYYEESGRPVDAALDRFVGWAPWPPGVLVGLLAAVLIAAVALACVLPGRSNRRTPELQVTETA
jgi:4-amino-4-deoxy-L-arabinose transferase-like glycosyltransferase